MLCGFSLVCFNILKLVQTDKKRILLFIRILYWMVQQRKQGSNWCFLCYCLCVCPTIRPSLRGSYFLFLPYCILLHDPPTCHLIFTFLYLQHPILLRLWHLHCSFILFFVRLPPDARCAVGCRQKQCYPRTCYNSPCSCVLQPAKFMCVSTALLRTTSCPPSSPHFTPCESSALCVSPAARGAT